MESLSPQNTTRLSSGPSQLEAGNDTRPLGPLSSSPPEPGIARHKAEDLLAAFEEAISQYRQGEEDGPYELRGKFSQADFEELDRHELKWRLAYDKVAHRIFLYGDPTKPHEATIFSLSRLIDEAASEFLANFTQTADLKFNQLSPTRKAWRLLHFSGGETCDLGATMKQADQLLQLRGGDPTRRTLAVEVAFCNESSRRAAEETISWVENGHSELALAVKIKKNTVNPYDPFITVFFSNYRERRPYMSTRGSVATRAVIHEWPCGSRSAVAAQEGPTIDQSNLDSLNLETATSPLSSNPSPVHYDPDFDAEVIFHGGGDPGANILQLPLGQAWAPERRAPTENIKFSDEDWDSVQPFSVNIHLGELRGMIIEHMQNWIENGRLGPSP